MRLHFFKYEATGNDFVVFDNRNGEVELSLPQIKHICDRRFGIGADGLMLLEKHESLDFNLVYYNSDGTQSLCGNGTRAAVRMASSLGLINGKASFNAFDGKHDAEIRNDGIISIRMNDVNDVRKAGDDWFVNTGSPHLIKFVQNLKDYPVFDEGRKIRYGSTYAPGGTNVNFVELLPHNTLFVRTYERGVENETLSCGTGVTAAALIAHHKNYQSPIAIKSLGGNLSVEFKVGQTVRDTVTFHDIFLKGPAKMVFQGDLDL